MKKIMILIMLILSSGLVSAAMDPSVPFCERQGYEYKIENDTHLCYFDETHACEVWKFFRGECGEEYRKELPCVTEGDALFQQSGEECCEGLESNFGWWYNALGQPHCVKKMGFFQKVKVWLFGF
ncbi:MAG: hypothetical protein KKE20_02845 [Nanoarchaeota archaeon]|nr:hypothetical protein [Nanoarchaeota archaeon]